VGEGPERYPDDMNRLWPIALFAVACDPGDVPGDPATVTVTLPVSHSSLRDLTAELESGGKEVRFTWTLDGEPSDFEGPVIPNDALEPGQIWRVAANVGAGPPQVAETLIHPGGNVLVVIVDDLGIDKFAAYDAHPDPAPTPVMDGLAADGVMFRSAWANPTCSPSRASMLTGRHARRSGIGGWIHPQSSAYSLPLAETTIPEVLIRAEESWATSAVGKWHLVGGLDDERIHHPTRSGFDWYAGTLGNANNHVDGNPEFPVGYFYHQNVRDAAYEWSSTYLTTATADDAIARLEVMPEPWFMWLAFNAPHEPIHVPPLELHNFDFEPNAPDHLRHAAMIEALDTELGRVLASMDERQRAETTIILVGDNGSAKEVITAPHDVTRCKGTLYEGGVNVPLVIAGPHVHAIGAETDALVHVVDIFSTVAEIGGVDLSTVPDEVTGAPLVIDGASLLPHMRAPESAPRRDSVYTEKFEDNGAPPYGADSRTVRGPDYKLVRNVTLQEDRFYAYISPYDEGNRIEPMPITGAGAAALVTLEAEMNRMIEELTFDH